MYARGCEVDNANALMKEKEEEQLKSKEFEDLIAKQKRTAEWVAENNHKYYDLCEEMKRSDTGALLLPECVEIANYIACYWNKRKRREKRFSKLACIEKWLRTSKGSAEN